jgi:hypothetical protein
MDRKNELHDGLGLLNLGHSVLSLGLNRGGKLTEPPFGLAQGGELVEPFQASDFACLRRSGFAQVGVLSL